MPNYPSDIAFTPSVKKIQEQNGSRKSYAQMEAGRGWRTQITPDLEAFLQNLDMFYLATANPAGQPYIQYKGGPPGFLKVLDEETLAFADFAGNQQYITLGNLADNEKCFLFLIDYAQTQRVKIWATATVVENDEALMKKLVDEEYEAKPQRAIVFKVQTWDINCPQHIHKRYSESQIKPLIEKLQTRITELEAKLKAKGEEI